MTFLAFYIFEFYSATVHIPCILYEYVQTTVELLHT